MSGRLVAGGTPSGGAEIVIIWPTETTLASAIPVPASRALPQPWAPLPNQERVRSARARGRIASEGDRDSHALSNTGLSQAPDDHAGVRYNPASRCCELLY